MMRFLRTQLLLLLLSVAVFAEERYPPPEFDQGYVLPHTQTPLPRPEWMAYQDILVLAVALVLASYLTLKRRSRAGVFALMLGSLAYFGFYRHGCVCPVGSIQNVAQALGQPAVALPLGVAAFFLLPLLVALFAGRAFCAGVCPLGAVQDVTLLRPVKVPAWLEHALGLLAYVYLGVAVLFAATGSAYLICRYDPFVAFFRLGGTVPMLTAGAIMLAVGVFVGRPYCRFFCPYGVLLRWVAPLARWRVRITPDICTQCRLCEDACPFGAMRYPTPTPAGDRREGKSRLVWLLMLLPVLIALGGTLGAFGSGILARQHAAVRLDIRLWQEEHHQVTGVTDESKAFRQLGQSREEVTLAATAIRRQFRIGGLLLGGWIGLLIGLKLILLSIRRRRTDYEADPAACLACGRCYRFCPRGNSLLERESEAPFEPATPASAGTAAGKDACGP